MAAMNKAVRIAAVKKANSNALVDVASHPNGFAVRNTELSRHSTVIISEKRNRRTDRHFTFQMATRTVRMVRMNQIAKSIEQFRPPANRTNSGAKNLANAFRMLGVATVTKTAMMTATKRIARRKNAIPGCSLAETADAFTTPGNAVRNID